MDFKAYEEVICMTITGQRLKGKTDVQLTPEQRGFELHRSTYVWFFFQQIHITLACNPWMVESTDAEP